MEKEYRFCGCFEALDRLVADFEQAIEDLEDKAYDIVMSVPDGREMSANENQEYDEIQEQIAELENAKDDTEEAIALLENHINWGVRICSV